MLEALIAWGKQIIMEFGLPGLFLLSFLTSTIVIPVPIDLFILAAIAGGLSPFYSCTLATIGSTMGVSVDFFLGYLGSRFVSSKFQHRDFHRAREWIDRHGRLAIFVCSLLPIPYDVIAIAAGAGKMRFPVFFALSLLGKWIKYMIMTYGVIGGIYLFSNLYQNENFQLLLWVLGIAAIIVAFLYYIWVQNNKS